MNSNASRPNFAVLLALAFALVAAWLRVQFWSSAAAGFSDPDDAMRLVQVREFIAGKGWFDLAEPRVDPPYGYLTHWSRLVDAGLAGLYWLARVFAEPPTAERVMIEIWPVLWLLPAMGGVCAIAWRCSGREAALAVLVLATFGLPAFQHFQPGRIDHHNVQLALAVLTVAAAAWSDRIYGAALAAGLLSALALAVGLESLPWIVLAGAALALRFVVDGEAALALRAYATALAGGTLAAFFAGVAPGLRLSSVCDALAFNLALPVILAGVMLAVIACTVARASRGWRAAGVALCAGIALGVFAGIEPRCLGGPFAMVDPAVLQTWLSKVEEMSPLVTVLRSMPLTGAWVSAFPAVAFIVAALLVQTPLRRDFGFLLASAALLGAVVLTFATVKIYSYAMWFAMPLVAAGVVHFSAHFKLSRAFSILMTFVLTPVVVSALAIVLLQTSVAPPASANPARQVCFGKNSYAGLAKLPVGVVAADVDFGPMVLAFTPHAVLAAPYHRLSHGILRVRNVFALPPAEAHAALLESKANYLILCGNTRPTGLEGAALTRGLWASIISSDMPAWLSRMPMPEGSGFTVYRVM